MLKFKSRLTAAAVLALTCLANGPAWAATSVTYVSGKGTDAGTCAAPTNPCRTIQFAVNQTAGGEVKALDPADYSPVTINKSISITGGVYFAQKRCVFRIAFGLKKSLDVSCFKLVSVIKQLHRVEPDTIIKMFSCQDPKDAPSGFRKERLAAGENGKPLFIWQIVIKEWSRIAIPQGFHEMAGNLSKPSVHSEFFFDHRNPEEALGFL
ncbi:MAG TPA: hypothetical protein VNY06_06450 [Methylocella sp.]|nr:hypothetical protein [Methylocella sp.]